MAPITVSQGERVPGAPKGLSGSQPRGMGLTKSTLGLHKTYSGLFRGGTKGRQREGPRWFGEERTWETRGIRG